MMQEKKEFTYQCGICGNTFKSFSYKAMYCSDKCRNKVKYQKRNGQKSVFKVRSEAEESLKINLDAVNEIIREAERHGLSWGKYMAYRDRGAVWG